MGCRRLRAFLKACIPLAITAFLSLGAYGGADFTAGDYVGVVPLTLDGAKSSYPGSQETSLGSLAADALRAASGADIAVVNGGDLVTGLESGNTYWEDVLSVFAENRALAAAEISGAQLKDILEISVGHIVTDTLTERIDKQASDYGGFAQISGFTFKYDASAPAGERILYAELSDGTPVDFSSGTPAMTISATAAMLSGEYGYEPLDHRVLQYGLADALAEYISGDSLNFSSDEYVSRIKVVGARENQLSAGVSVPLLIGGCVVLAALCVLFRKKLVRL